MDAIKIMGSVVGAVSLRFLDPQNADILFYTRLAFFCGAAFSAALLLTLFCVIMCKPSLKQHFVQVKQKSLQDYIPFLPQKKGAPQVTDQSHRQYDLEHLGSQALQVAVSFGVAAVLHLYFGYFPPIVLQTAMIPLSLMNTELVWLHLFCRSEKTSKELKRPWEDNQPTWGRMFKDLKKEMMQQMGKGGGARKNKRNENRRAVRRQ